MARSLLHEFQMKTLRQLGRHIVTEPKVCHGQPTFRGTRILMADVLDQIADGVAWETIIEKWHGSLTAEAIAEVVNLAGRAFPHHAAEYALRPSSA